MSLCDFTQTIAGYRWRWPEDGLVASITRLKQRSDGLQGRVAFYVDRPGSPEIISASEFRLLSTRSQTDLVRHLEKRVPALPWDRLVEMICVQAQTEYERGTPAILLTGQQESISPDYLLRPLIMRDTLNMFFGDGDGGKSLLTEHLAYFFGFGGTHLGFEFPQLNVLILDYEMTAKEIDQRLTAISQQWGRPLAQNVYHRECHLPITEERQSIAEQVYDLKIGLVITDSYGMASPGDINVQDTARQVCMALRSLKTTILGIHHVSLDAVKGGFAHPTGSRYWQNEHRWTWFVQAEEEGPEKCIALYHKKHNLGPLVREPIGFRLRWENDMPYLIRDDASLRDAPELVGRMLKWQQIREVLRQFGILTAEEIKAKTGIKSDTIRKTLGRYEGKEFQRRADGWGLLSNEGA